MSAASDHRTAESQLPPAPDGAGASAGTDLFLGAVEQCLRDLVEARSAVLLDVSADLEPVVRTIGDLAPGGKRLRASFCHWGWLGAGGGRREAAVAGAAALELFHLAALVHDDLMDHSDTRRGLATAHETFSLSHRSRELDGDADDFGVGTALLIGDLCLAWSDELLAEACDEPATHRAARGVYDTMRTQVMAGQYLDMYEQARPGHRTEASRRVLRYKSAKYSVEHPLQLGGALGGAPADLQDAYTRFGIPVGEAFQLRDDVLGVFGDPAQTGKPVGDDLRDGKKTLLVIEALERASDDQRRLLESGLGGRDMSEAEVRGLQDVLVDTGALDHVEQQIADLTAEGVAAIGLAPVPVAVARGLSDLALHIAGRSA